MYFDTLVGWLLSFGLLLIILLRRKKTSVARDLKDLVQLKEDGILSEKEFEKERKNLLG